ncbi:DNA-directed RNA polymerase subunit P [Methanococcus maripaludis]|jgi:DNA-directed RNA polymerase subunit P|uniref:DNA-directed RNA polymerase subunit Rpo12 n=7 Tax=Methanococcus maripaludis TaxID=39152 RepID=A0A2L1CA29_METMI|nr:DNA-directed RNA polymerase subunit P [Methanococcus maripaludis]ABO35723.1 DNA-directed RNA polymerase, subunit P [Methanococcus maripaludis C5]AEK19139.1 DNA-directed RNA polymerase subunit P [Methanococcus maripaludis X1]AVB76222.1 DNA-directed RNA polymerase subunit P [Methanococcus maripaludis]MBA2846052.1 DNA-directed RNA polymerase subunit P [Methanococcus maripaludis]MBA2851285.1 DNA-directed RNA polymerase subunit P [Methanococcus maripaludis]
MAEYRCSNCGKIVTLDEIGLKAKCPHCSNRVLIKLRPKIVKKVQAR